MVFRPATSPLEGDGLAPAAAFANPKKLRAAYEAESLALCQKSVRSICILGIVLVLPFVVFDYVRNPAAFEWAVLLRTANVGVFLISLWLIPRESSAALFAGRASSHDR